MKVVRRCVAMAVFAAAILQTAVAFAATVPAQSVLGVSFSDATHGYLAGGYTDTDGVLAYTADGGVTWKPSQYANRRTWAIGSSTIGSSATAVADYFDEAISTTNSGGTWSAATTVFGGELGFGGQSHINDVAYLSNGRVAVGQQEGTALNGNVAVIARDIGGNWTPDFRPLYAPDPIDGTPNPTYATLTSIDAIPGGSVAWAVGTEYSLPQNAAVKSSLFYRTADGGVTWTPDLATGALLNEITAVTAADSNVAYATYQAAGLGSRYFLRRTGAGTWARSTLQIAAGFQSNALDAYDADHLVVVGESGKVYYTANATNATPTWAAFTAGTGSLYGVQMTGPDSWVVVGSNETIVRFTSGGATQAGSYGVAAPTVALTSLAPGFSLPVASIAGVASDAGVGVLKVEVQIQRQDGMSWNGLSWVADPFWLQATGTNSWSCLFTPGAPSPTLLTITARATDGMGQPSVPAIVSSDITPPTTTVSTVPATQTATGWKQGPVSVTYTATDGAGGSGVSSTRASIDGAAAASFANPTVVSKEGATTIKYWSVDNAGNSETTKTLEFKTDSTAPVTTHNAAASYTAAGSIALTPTDAGGSGVSSTTWQISGPASSSGTGTNVPIPFTAGSYTLSFRSTDNVGNAESLKTASFTYVSSSDIIPPTTTVSTVPATQTASGWKKGPVSVSHVATDGAGGSGVSTTRASIDGAAAASFANPTVVSKEGTTTIKYWSVDNAGNSETTKTLEFKTDSTAPVTTHNAAASYPAAAGGLVILGPTDAGSGTSSTTWQITGTAGSSGTGTSVPVPPNVGSYTLSFRSTDNVGNVESPKTASFVVMPLSPGSLTGTVSSFAGGTISGVSVSVTGTATILTAGGGSYAVAGIAQGTYDVTYAKPGFASKTQSVTIASGTPTTLNVVLVPTYTLTYTHGPGGTVSGVAVQPISHGTPGTPVIAVPGANYVFTGWSDGVATATRIDPGTASVDATANFVLPVTVQGSQAASAALVGTVTSVGTLTVEATVTAPTPPPGSFLVLGSGYEVHYTGQVNGHWLLTLPYDSNLSKPIAATIKVRHLLNNGTWEIITPLSVDTVNYTVTFETDTLSPFVLTAGDIVTADIGSVSPATSTFGAPVTFSGTGTDPAHALTYQWRSSRDGFLSAAQSFSTASLSAGTHTIYFKVTCAQGIPAEKSTTVVVNAAGTGLSASVSPSRPKRNKTATFRTYVNSVTGVPTAGTATYQMYRYETKTVKKKVRGRWKKVKVKYWRLRNTKTVGVGGGGLLTTSYKHKYTGKWKVDVTYSGTNYGSSVVTKYYTVR